MARIARPEVKMPHMTVACRRPRFGLRISMKNLTMRQFSNFDSRTMKEQERLLAALKALEGMIVDPMYCQIEPAGL
jgi:hypothetical protein